MRAFPDLNCSLLNHASIIKSALFQVYIEIPYRFTQIPIGFHIAYRGKQGHNDIEFFIFRGRPRP